MQELEFLFWVVGILLVALLLDELQIRGIIGEIITQIANIARIIFLLLLLVSFAWVLLIIFDFNGDGDDEI